jgi:hypothetical protein
MVIRTWLMLCLGAACAPMLAGCARSAAGGAPAVHSGSVASPPASVAPAKPAFVRPTLEVHRGEYFSYEMPEGWQAAESANGVDMTSPDGKMSASSALLSGAPGSTTPWGFVQNVAKMLGLTSVKRLSARTLPPHKSGYPGIDWTIQEFEIACADKEGIARRASVACGICNAYGSYSAILQTYSTPVGEFDRGKTWLPRLVESVKAINPGRVAYQDNIIPVRNNPLDDSAIMESWEARQQSQDRISQKQHETTMGYERMVSPVDGRHYNMPFESYDAAAGGYRDPADRNGTLKHAPPGQ